MDGTFEHQDSHGGGGVITNGDTQWMTAGSGLLHIERPPESLVVSGGLFHGLQLWVNLPKADKWLEPKYQDLRGGEAALLTSHDGGALIRLIAGELGGHAGPGTHVHADDDGARHHLPRRLGAPAVAARLQRARLRALRHGHGRRRPPSGAHRPGRALRARATRSPWPPTPRRSRGSRASTW